METNDRRDKASITHRAKLETDRAVIEDAAALLVKELNALDHAIKSVAPARQIALRITSTILSVVVLTQKLTLAQVTIWNEM